MISNLQSHTIPPEILKKFSLRPITSIDSISVGNINKTYKVSTDTDSYILQNINPIVFKDPTAIDHNLCRLAAAFVSQESSYQVPTPLPATDGETLLYDGRGRPWRLLPFVADADNFNTPPSAEYAYQAARTFADFSSQASTVPQEHFHYTIANFHDLARYEVQYEQAQEQVSPAHLEAARETMEGFADFSYIGQAYRHHLQRGAYTKRVHHHDTKINNLLFHRDQPTVKTIIDLDTVMPGYFFSDLGDLLMFGAGTFEDETDVSKVTVHPEYHQAILTGYQDGLPTLSEEERSLLPFSALIMCYMLGLRFLADYLAGEVYFKAEYPGQNLDKAHNRLALLQALAQLQT